jgi:hypothetical protein
LDDLLPITAFVHPTIAIEWPVTSESSGMYFVLYCTSSLYISAASEHPKVTQRGGTAVYRAKSLAELAQPLKAQPTQYPRDEHRSTQKEPLPERNSQADGESSLKSENVRVSHYTLLFMNAITFHDPRQKEYEAPAWRPLCRARSHDPWRWWLRTRKAIGRPSVSPLHILAARLSFTGTRKDAYPCISPPVDG